MAAHDAGLIHRDFKPSNVLVGHDGRVRVVDFGLAQSTDAPPHNETTSSPGDGPSADASPAEARLTATGMAAGTPAYMAPEQLVVGPVDAKADQYSFCITAWEVLFGERPTPKKTAADGASPEVASLQSALLKGMREQPRRRHKNMATLLALVEPHAADRTRGTGSARRWLVLSASAAVVLGAVLAGQWLSSSQSRGNCIAAGDRVDEVWTADVREQLQNDMIAADASYGPFAAEKVIPRLDEYAESWRQDTTQACMNQHVHGTWDQETADRARWCLDERLLRISAFVETMEEADPQSLRRAIQAASDLPRTQGCLDRANLPDQAPAPPVEMLPKLASLLSAVSRGRALGAAGRYQDGLDAIRQARSEAEGVNWGPLEAATLLAESRLERSLDHYDLAEETGAAAYAEAIRTDAWDIAANAAIRQISLVGSSLARKEDGLLWADLARVAIDRSGDPFRLLEASFAHNLGQLHRRAGNLAEAKRLATVSLQQRQQALGESHPAVADALSALAVATGDLGDLATAEHLATDAVRIYEDTFGQDHPQVVVGLVNLGRNFIDQGEVDKAERVLLRAQSIQKQTLGGDDISTAHIRANLGSLYLRKGQRELALEFFRRTLETYRRSLGQEHPDFAVGLYHVGLVLAEQHKFAEAATVLRRSVAIGERTKGPNHVEQAWSSYSLGEVYRKLKQPGDAALLLAQSIRVFELNYGREYAGLAYPLSSLGSLAMDKGKFDEAIDFLERAVRLDATPPAYSATTRFDLARALWKTDRGPSQERALTIARQVEADLVPGEHKDYAGEWIAEREAWIAERKQEIAKRDASTSP